MGERLLTDVAEATGLPSDLVTDELSRLLKNAGVNESEMTLDDLRTVLADYMQEILLAARDEHEKVPGTFSGGTESKI